MTIATIISITGQAWARDASGNLRELQVGDTLQEGETLVTSDNGRVELDFADGIGDPTVIEGVQEVVMTPDLDAEQPVDAEDASVQDEDLQALLAAIEEGEGDLLADLDATAAGGGAGGEGGGHDFVRLARITENLNPLSYEYGLTSLEGTSEIEGQALDEEPDSFPTVDTIDLDGDGDMVWESALPETGSGGGTLTTSGAFQIDTGNDLLALIEVQDAAGNWVEIGADGTQVTGLYGILTVNTDGSWSYTLEENTLDHDAIDAVGTADQVQDLFGVRVTDDDGDVSPVATLTIDVNDDGPVASDYDHATAITEGSGDTVLAADAADALGIGAGADGIEVALEDIAFTNQGTTGGSLTIDDAGQLVYTAPASVDSTAGAVTETFEYTVVDQDGDSVTRQVTVDVSDAGDPTLSASNGLLADEDDLPTIGNADLAAGDDSPTLSGTLSFDNSTSLDAFDLSTLTLSVGTDGDTGLTTLDGSAVTATWVGNQLIGHTGTDASVEANQVFVIDVTNVTQSGANYALTLLQPIQHADPTDPAAFEDNVDFTVDVSLQDTDGSEATTSISVAIDDDMPTVVSNGEATPIVAAVAEDALSTSAGDTGDLTDGNLDAGQTLTSDEASGTLGSLASLVTVNDGADAPASVRFGLQSTTDGLPTLYSGGVLLSYDVTDADQDGVNDTLTAKAGGDIIFTLTVNANGSWSFDLDGPLDHVATDSDTTTALVTGDETSVDAIDFSGLVSVAVEDADGDVATLDGLAAGAFTVTVENDLPTVVSNGQATPVVAAVAEDALSTSAGDTGDLTDGNLDAGQTLASDEASGTLGSLASLITVNDGADAPASVRFGLQSTTDGLPTLYSGGVLLSYDVTDADQDGVNDTLTAKAGGDIIFTLTVNANGSWSFDLDGPLDHVATDSDTTTALVTGDETSVDAIDFSGLVSVAVEDADGDVATLDGLAAGAFTVTVENDLPTVVSNGQATPVVAAVAEDALSTSAGDTGDLTDGNLDAGQTLASDEASGTLGSLASLITVNDGADAPASVRFGLQSTTDGLPTLYSGGVLLSYDVTDADQDGVNDTLTAKAGGDIIFTLTVNANGSWSFDLDGPLDHVATDSDTTTALVTGDETSVDAIDFSGLVSVAVEDADGDVATLDGLAAGAFTVTVENDLPTVVSNGQATPVVAAVAEDALSTSAGDTGDLTDGNLDAGQTLASDEASGTLGSLASLITVNDGADAPASVRFGLQSTTDGLPTLYSGGVLLSYDVTDADQDGVNDTLTAKAGGDIIFTLTVNANGSWSFDLDGPLDHVATDSDTTTALVTGDETSVDAIDFSGLVSVAVEDADGDVATLDGLAAGAFTVTVENDLPTVVSNGQATPIVAAVAEDALSTSAGDTGDLTDGNLDAGQTLASDEASGTLGSLASLITVNDGADAPASVRFGLQSTTDGLPTLYSGGVLLSYDVTDADQDGVNDTLTAKAGGDIIFTLTVNANGSWSFDLDGPLDHVATDSDTTTALVTGDETSVDAIDFSGLVSVAVEDADGDVATLDGLAAGAFTVTVENDLPTVVSNGQATPVVAAVAEDALSTSAGDTGDLTDGNLDAGQTLASDEASGTLGSLASLITVNDGADAPASVRFGLQSTTDGLPTLYSGGVLLSYDVTDADQDGVNDTLTAKAGGDIIFTLTVNANGSWSFDLDGPLDHVATDSDTTTALVTGEETSVDAIDFSGLVSVAVEDADGDVATLDGLAAGAFTVTVENDMPAPFYPQSGHVLLAVDDSGASEKTVTQSLNFLAGADGLGDIVFNLDLVDGRQAFLSVDGDQLYLNNEALFLQYADDSHHTIQAVTESGDVGFTATIDALGNVTYTIFSGSILTDSKITSVTDLSGIGGGNVPFKGLNIGTKQAADPDGTDDVLVSSEILPLTDSDQGTVNSTSTTLGVGQGAEVSGGEVVRYDLVSNLSIDDTNNAESYTFSGYQETLAFSQKVAVDGSQKEASFYLRIYSMDLGDSADGATSSLVSGPDGAGQLTLTVDEVKIYDDNGVEQTGHVTIEDGELLVSGMQDGWTFQIVSVDGNLDPEAFNAVEIQGAELGGDAITTSFKLGEFSYGEESTFSPVSFTLPVTGSDADGDSLDGQVAITVYPDSESIVGDAQGNDLSGTSGDDSLFGLEGDDTLTGGQGDDVLAGGLGADTFAWSFADNSGDQGTAGSPAVDLVTDFNLNEVSEGDVLQLNDLLPATGGDVGSYIHAVEDGEGNTLLHISSNGAFDGGFDANNADQIIALNGVSMEGVDSSAFIQSLIADGQLDIE
ncbi:hypothetical protein BOX17_00305 [Halomonas aestuarii]|uniref:Retention module-containing protein n=1 Tax=Halomonas aestuarii TaxID=1897729 RepID=A0A1J0VBX3_9GAMM|nr:retention module-containing protein [Halomonas aestuarii]APE29534.1 hypothetical protein BOX17_00305 [Halomonas aestuarii]